MKVSFKRYIQNSRGAAAIEFVLILPFMLLIFFGMVDITGLITMSRKVTYSAAVVGDLVSQNSGYVLLPAVVDTFNAADIIFAPTTGVRVEVFDFRVSGSGATMKWSTNNGQGQSCGPNPDTATVIPLMTAGNDVIVSRSCTTYVPYVATFMGQTVMGALSYQVKSANYQRPRGTLMLDCFQTTQNGTSC